MKKNVISVIALVGLVIWGVYDYDFNEGQSGSELSAPVGIQKGNVAPDFELQTIDGQSVKLSDFRGKKVIVNMWATWCPPCRAEMPDMQRFYEENQDKDVTILGVNLTVSEKRPETIPKFIDEFQMTFPVVLDDQEIVANLYQITSIPTSYMIDSRGIIQEKVIGPMNEDMMKELVGNME